MTQKFTFSRIAEITACVLTALLPIKFASIVSVPEMPASYWFDFFSVLLASWPIHIFSFFSAILLAMSLPYEKSITWKNKQAGIWSAGLLLLAVLSLCGWFHASCKEYALQMISYSFGVASYGLSLFFLLEKRTDFRYSLLTALCIGTGLSIMSGLYQYFYGFEALTQHVYQQNLRSDIPQITGQFLTRIQETRLQADFSVCNTYGGYLAFMLSVVFACVWLLGRNYVEPQKKSCWILSVPIAVVMLFLIWQTGSRGAVFSLCAACTVMLFALPVKRKWRIIAAVFVLAAIGGFITLAALGRGFNSMIFRFDYDWAACRMMFTHPLAGTGWGDFFHDYQILKLLTNDEAPHTPHNMPFLFGSQCGIPAFMTALFVLLYPLFAGFCRVWKSGIKDFLFLALLFGLSSAAADAMLEITYETPGFFCVFLVLCLVLFYHNETSAVQKQGRGSIVILSGLAVSLFTLLFSLYMIRAERSFSIFQENVDLRFSREAMFDKNYQQLPPERIIQMMNQAEKDDPLNPFIPAAGCDYMLGRGDLYNAELLINKAIELSPRRAAFYLRRAQITFFKTGNEALCRKDLETVRRLFPMNDKYRVSDRDLLLQFHDQKQ